ncbi:MAG: hypothetical protein O3A93_08065 [Chloroflexi bacterium]|nr:hypothetical protein [Chloroflexota bacterium]MDA1271199.1 hypothetical protein [Chloroflexota bacterium]PKB59321.1 MAG: hypothetical protein BZY83_02510 [SAR202 cluster bacterium Casp-Chloro-G2]
MAATPDSHDLDKLNRWHEGLNSDSGKSESSFPVCAVFLVSSNDGRAHDIFRRYRTVFEELGAGFHDLVIFGQHGASTTCAAVLSDFGLGGLKISSLALITSGDSLTSHATSLPAGVLAGGELETEGDAVPWSAALEVIREAVEAGKTPELGSVNGLERVHLPSGALASLVGRVKEQIEGL